MMMLQLLPLRKRQICLRDYSQPTQPWIRRERLPPSIPNSNTSMPDITFRHRTIKRILSKLDCKKAVGSDGVPAIDLKKCAPELTPILVRLFTMSYKRGKFPSSWKLARVQPVPKKGKKTIPSNYRTIAVLPIISKVMRRL